MTSDTLHDLARSTPQQRPIRLAPLGWYTRSRFLHYVESTFLVSCAILMIGLTIDVPSRLTKVLEQGSNPTGIWAVVHVAWYMLLRTVDILTEMFPIAVFLGVFIAEASHSWSRERLVVWNTGRSPMQCLAPVLLFAVLAASFQLSLDLYLRPAVVATQIANHLGDFGEWFDRKARRTVWLPADDEIITARVSFGPPPVMRSLTAYQLGEDGQLVGVTNARSAIPASSDGEWLLQDGTHWQAVRSEDAGSQSRAQPPSPAGTEIGFKQRSFNLGVDPVWLANYGIQPKYLPHQTLVAIASSPEPAYDARKYRTWVQLRYSRMAYIVGLVLLGSAMSYLLLAYRTRFEALLGIAATGYCAHVLMRSFTMLGEYGYVSPAMAGWLVPGLLLFVGIGALVFSEFRQAVR